MKKLYLNIRDIRLEGRPEDVLQKPIDIIDKSVEDFFAQTEQMRRVIYKHCGANQGKQYKRAFNSITVFSRELYEMSIVLNDVQNQVARFAEKCIYYEDVHAHVSPPRKHSVNLSEIQINTGVVYFLLENMLEVRDAIRNYVRGGEETVATLKRQVDNLNCVWKDSQFRDFKEMVEEVCRTIITAVNELCEYELYLTKKINDLENKA